MNLALLGLLVASTFFVSLPSAVAGNGVGPKETARTAARRFESEADFYLKRVEDLRSLAVNRDAQGSVASLRDQNLDGTAKGNDFPDWFVKWHAASSGGTNPMAKSALAIRDKFYLDEHDAKKTRMKVSSADRAELKQLFQNVFRANDEANARDARSMVCDEVTGSCEIVDARAVLGSASRSNPKRSGFGYGSGGGSTDGAGTGMAPTAEDAL